MIISICAFWVFVVHTRMVAHPLFEREMLRDGSFLMALLSMAILGVTNIALSSVLPTMYQSIYGYSVMDTGLLMAPRGLGVLASMLVVSRLINHVDSRVLITLGYGFAAFSLHSMAGWSLDIDQKPIIVSGFIQGMGLGLLFVPINIIAFNTLAPRYRPDGTTLMTLVRNLGSSFGISFIVTVLARNMQVAHADIAASVTSFNVPAIDPATVAAQTGDLGAAGLAMLNGEVTRQAAMIAYLDNFTMMFWLLLAITPLVWLLKRPRLPGKSPPIDTGH
jgi:MFS transporter, DHA2 family, multidrug resistance protein